ncbi:RNA polymerase sigma factor (sigma-70 family) [Novosphingobium sp. PhB165]|uniref:sigma-70 region 4 domain-containing protein n=1 Tax=Novosphingobium sp. PhB165 TaxID=2485105 RepID=UPI0010EF397C|nr:sigma-70 region 4 domain-containing protein [Novosphingobium sp. PhB165]TCM19051.1 RNA polymerase sigma factor (sigma-70 family) [Novosphingobium sp. PhB165]
MEQKSDQASNPEGLARIEAALAELPQMQRQIFLARCVYHMEMREIARQTGLSERRVHIYMGRAINALVRSVIRHDQGDV